MTYELPIKLYQRPYAGDSTNEWFSKNDKHDPHYRVYVSKVDVTSPIKLNGNTYETLGGNVYEIVGDNLPKISSHQSLAFSHTTDAALIIVNKSEANDLFDIFGYFWNIDCSRACTHVQSFISGVNYKSEHHWYILTSTLDDESNVSEIHDLFDKYLYFSPCVWFDI